MAHRRGPTRARGALEANGLLEQCAGPFANSVSLRHPLAPLTRACRAQRVVGLARSLSHMAALGDEFHTLGVEFAPLTEGIDTATPTGRALFGMCRAAVDSLTPSTSEAHACARRP